ncbi:unnamed protein product [Ambrosiozyma monospora]|uniref:Unnamed protein product n=1 Tax=Ambrosiozyma monospora TaxID=43982 RepID=A0ACB5T8S7_AMBMO|nr:unnamed protein product [Ambrosiozyma monospora]
MSQNKVSTGKSIDSLSHGIAGGLSGLVSMTLTYPLVRLSTKAQASNKGGDLELESELRTLKSEAKLKSILNLYSGLESALIGIIATNFSYYYFYEFTASKLKKHPYKLDLHHQEQRLLNLEKVILENSDLAIISPSSFSPKLQDLILASSSTVSKTSQITKTQPKTKNGLTVQQSLLCGAVAGIISRAITNPIWVANTRLSTKSTTSNSQNTSTIKLIISIVKNEGWQALFKGLTPALALVLNPVIQYTIFEQLKNLLVKRRGGNGKLTPLDALFLGSFGKLISTIVTYPYITIRSRMHLSTAKSSEQEKGMLAVAKDILFNEGLGSFYKGLSLKLFQSILSAAFLFYFKEQFVEVTDNVVKRLKMLIKLFLLGLTQLKNKQRAKLLSCFRAGSKYTLSYKTLHH